MSILLRGSRPPSPRHSNVPYDSGRLCYLYQPAQVGCPKPSPRSAGEVKGPATSSAWSAVRAASVLRRWHQGSPSSPLALRRAPCLLTLTRARVGWTSSWVQNGQPAGDGRGSPPHAGTSVT